MQRSSSIRKISFRRQPGRLLRPVILLLSLLALVLASCAVWAFIEADKILHRPSLPLETFTSNVMPPFSAVSFPSLDEQTTIYGWYMPARQSAVSSIILVHDQDKNRLQFGQSTALLYQHLTGLGFNVLSFDLRASGQSEGTISAFGYAEWADVLAAIRYVQKTAATTDVILYGFGSGTAAVLGAWQKLPADKTEKKGLAEEVAKLDLDRSYISGLILDSPAPSPDEPIRQLMQQRQGLAQKILPVIVPYAVRISAGSSSAVNHNTILGACLKPVLIIQQPTDSPARAVSQERERLLPDLTQISQVRAETKPFQDDSAYLAALTTFLERFFPAPHN